SVGVILAAALFESGFHFRNDFGFLFWIIEAFDKLAVSTVLRAVGNKLTDTRAGSRVGILVLGNVESFGASFLDGGENFGGVAPIGWSGKFNMGNFGADSGFSSDAENFVERFQDAVAFTALMRGVNAVVCGGYFRQLNDLLGLGKNTGEIN